MPWIDDVVPYATILSTWGNNIRNHAPALFTSIGDRDTNAAKMTEGQLAYCINEKSLFVRRPSAAAGFSTLVEPWKNYTIQYQLDHNFTPSITQYIGRWRRVGGTTVEFVNTFVINSNYGAGQNTLIWTLPVTHAIPDGVIGNGEAYDNAKYCIGPVRSYPTDGNWGQIIDQATRQGYVPQSGTPVVRVHGSYEVADG